MCLAGSDEDTHELSRGRLDYIGEKVVNRKENPRRKNRMWANNNYGTQYSTLYSPSFHTKKAKLGIKNFIY